MRSSSDAQNPMPTWLQASMLHGMLRGIERESLRMQSNGFLSQQPHPKALGSALTHPSITTDYSEALLEFITSPQESIHRTREILKNIHLFTQQHLPQGERLWPLSMPCMLDQSDENIPLANYGSSNLGRFKTLYRHGLGVRYGRRMQTISGVHYNLSFPDTLFQQLQQHETDESLKQLSLQDYRSHRYFGLIRNFIRFIPMVMYLLGASPTVCACFVAGRQHHLHTLMPGTLYLPNATALRMGRLGYQNSAQQQLGIQYNSLAGYLQGIRQAIHTPYPAFQKLGLDDAHGEPIQINDHILQIENEYYSLIRPKQTPKAGETPSQALQARGVAYVELRAVDVDPFNPIGISEQSAAFLETLALYCLLSDSPLIDAEEQQWLDENQAKTVNDGRDAALTVQTLHGEVRLRDWMAQHLRAMQSVATCLDQAHQTQLYQSALSVMQQRCEDANLTLSAQILQQTRQLGGNWQVGAALAEQHETYYRQQHLSTDIQQQFEQIALQSLQQQQQLERQQQLSFREYLQPYRQMMESS